MSASKTSPYPQIVTASSIYICLLLIAGCSANETLSYECTGSATSVDLTPEGQPTDRRLSYPFEDKLSINIDKKFVLVAKQKVSVDANITGSAIEWDLQEEDLRLHFRLDRNTGHYQGKGKGVISSHRDAPTPYELSLVGGCTIK